MSHLATVKNWSAIPMAMQARNQWVLWKYESRKGKPTKPPFQSNGKYAASDNPGTWHSFGEVSKATGFDGIGYVFAEGDGCVGIDLDHCITNGAIDPWASDILALFPHTYIERSPSGEGVHIIGLGKPVKTGSRKWTENGNKVGIEIYDATSPRYFTVTGDPINQSDLGDCQAQLEPLHQIVFGNKETTKPKPLQSVTDLKRTPPEQINLNELQEILTAIKPDRYDSWYQVGMAIKGTGITNGFEIWDGWSSNWDGYSSDECHEKWRNDFKNPKSGITKLRNMAEERGWQPRSEAGMKITRLERENGRQSTETGGDNIPRPLTDNSQLGIARAVLNSFGDGNVIFAQQAFHIWTGKVWKICDDHAMRRQIIAVCEVIDPASGKTKEITSTRVGGILQLMMSEAFRDDVVFNVPSNTINCLNGELRLHNSSWQLHPHQRESYRLSLIPAEFDPGATCPRFKQFLDEIFAPDRDAAKKKACLLEFLGYSLTSNWELNWRFEKFIILIGRGSNGKSKIENLLGRLLGAENICAVDPSKFESPFQLAYMRGKLVNFVAEIKEGGDVNDAALKRISSAALITVENKYGHPFSFRPYAKCWFGTNHLPHVRDITHAFFRRALILQFNVTFRSKDDQDRKPEDPLADRELDAKLAAELPGILNLCLKGLSEIVINGFTEPPSSIAIKNRWRSDCDQIALFVEECCTTGVGYSSTSAELYQKYKEWAAASGVNRTFARNKFGTRLGDLGFPDDKGTGGIRRRDNIAVDYSKCDQ